MTCGALAQIGEPASNCDGLLNVTQRLAFKCQPDRIRYIAENKGPLDDPEHIYSLVRCHLRSSYQRHSRPSSVFVTGVTLALIVDLFCHEAINRLAPYLVLGRVICHLSIMHACCRAVGISMLAIAYCHLSISSCVAKCKMMSYVVMVMISKLYLCL